MGISKYIIAALALICMVLGITIAIQEVRLSHIKSELKETALQRDNLAVLSASQTERLDKLNLLLVDAEKACLKRLDARRAVNEIFKKKPPAVTAHRPPVSASSVGVSVIINNNSQDNFNENIITIEESVAAIRHINNSFGVQWQDGNL